MGSDSRRRVAVVGASGIGKFHAAWWHLVGMEVAAFAGTSPASVEATAETLHSLFGFSGTGYTDVADMLASERLAILDVCSPHATHFEYGMLGLNAGCDVLCEKPLVFDRRLRRAELVGQARDLVLTAERAGQLFGLCTQHYVAAQLCEELRSAHGRTGPVIRCRIHLASPALGRSPDPFDLWGDLAPHLVGAVQALAPQGDLDWDTAQVRFEGDIAAATFTVRRADGPALHCDLTAGRRRSDPLHERSFEIDGDLFEFGGAKGEDGVFHARIATPWGSVDRPDMMHRLIREFAAGRAAVDGRTALRNVDWMLRLQDLA